MAFTCAALVWSAEGLADCQAQSGPRTAALVELYTSEGCSSCPPADRQMRLIRQLVGADADVVPLSLHVDYWDAIGWKDRFAQARFGQRQSWLVQASGQNTVYTPQFFVSGSEIRDWRSGLSEKVRRVNAMPAAANLRLRAELSPAGTLVVRASTQSQRDSAALYLAVAESGLTSSVSRGENAGATLAHDNVVRVLVGPTRLSGGELQVVREIPISPTWNADQIDVVAFVINERTGEVLQALASKGCARP